MLKNRLGMMVAGVAGFGMTMAVAAWADETDVPAILGHAWIPSEQTCFSSSYGIVLNTANTAACKAGTGRRKFLVGVPIRYEGGGTYWFYGGGTNSGGPQVQCRAVVAAASGTFLSETGLVNIGTGQVQFIGSLNVGIDRNVHFDCDIPSRALNANAVGLASLKYETAF